MAPKILVVGASGYFGKILVRQLLERGGAEVIAAGRSLRRFKGAFGGLRVGEKDRLSFAELDLARPGSLDPWLDGVRAAVCAAGPYQGLSPTLAAACLPRGVHYLDLADDRAFVLEVARLARSGACRGAVCPGWSAVPALSAVLARIACAGLGAVDSIRVALAPGNRSPRAAGTVGSLLSSLGRTFSVPSGGSRREVRGWSEPREFDFPPPVGPRRGWLVDAPDYELFPGLFGARTVEFRVGAELPVLNWGASALALLGRALSADWTPLSGPVSLALAPLGRFGTDAGAVGVEASGLDGSRRRTRRVCVVADTEAPRIAVMPAVFMLERLLGEAPPHGLVPWDAWAGREDLEACCRSFGFRLTYEDEDRGLGTP